MDRRVFRGRLLPAGLLVLSTAQAVHAQRVAPRLPIILEGLVVDGATGLPVPNVQIRFPSGEWTITDGAGRYHMEGAPPGAHVVALVTGRCSVSFGRVELAPGEIKQVAFSIPTEVAEEGPSAESVDATPGTVLTAAEITATPARDLLQVVRRVAPEMVGFGGAQPGRAARLTGRTRAASLGEVEPVVVVDGVPAVDGSRALEELRPVDVARLAIRKGAGAGWTYGTGGQGGVIEVWTRRGERGHGVGDPLRCEVSDWPGHPHPGSMR